jgi:tetratricopeptide (TPR) repeat protein
VAPVGSDQPPEVRIVAGEDVVIHDMSPPTRVQVDMQKICRGTTQLVVNGVTTSGDTFAFNRGSVSYHVLCDDIDVARGSVVVTRDSLMRPMPSAPPVNSIRADGRTYKISFQTMPALEVGGGPGTLHVANGSQERTYEAKGDSVLIPSTDLAQGQYKIWFQPDKMSTVDIALDTSAPIISFDQLNWGAQAQLEGTALSGSSVSVESIALSVDKSGRFKAVVPGDSGVLVLRVEHPSAGLHYAIARQTLASVTPSRPVTVTQKLPNTLDRVSILRTMTMLKSKFFACTKTNPPKGRGTVKVKVAVKPDGKVQTVDVAQGLEPMLDQCLVDTIHATTFAPATQTTSFMYPIVVEVPTAAQLCDADLHKDKGIDNVNLGQYAAALSQFEASLRCKEDGHVTQLAFMSACKARNEPKATYYYTKLTPAQRQKFAQVCVRNNIDPSGQITGSGSANDTHIAPPPNCDANALKDKGMEYVNLAQHDAALKAFETSLACKNDSYVVALAFMSACSAQNESRAQKYWWWLTDAQRTKYKVMCVRNKLDPDTWTRPAADPNDGFSSTSTEKGYLWVNSKPKAKILIDGVDTGLTTPITGKTLPLTPGKHKVTFVIDDDRFTYPVLIQPGKTEVMSKDLR